VTAAVEAVDVSRTYELDGVSVPALRGVSLRVEPGGYLAILGPSGSGKSTLMHLLGGLDRPSGGRLLIDGRDVAHLGPAELAALRNRTIGFVFQAFHLLPRTSALDNVALPLVYRGVPGRQRRALAAAMLGRVGLDHRLDHRPNQLSGGEQQRVAICRALANRPGLLILDEPTAQLDSANSLTIMELVRDLVASESVSAIVATHDTLLLDVADAVVELRDGQLVDGP
jgi:putative ABC transport system ATP-binding protein